MNVKSGTLLCLLVSVTGCQLIKPPSPPAVEVQQVSVPEPQKSEQRDCISEELGAQDPQLCELSYWLHFWYEAAQLSWAQRKVSIEQLDSGLVDSLKKVLLSSIKGTPYNDRLRAQAWLDELQVKLSPSFARFMQMAVYETNQQLLELESALASLNKINVKLTSTNDKQKVQLKKQQSQIEQLLKIEATIMDSGSGDNL